MATQFSNPSLDGSRYLPTSEVSSIKATTDKHRIDVSLICERGLDGAMETLYSTTLYAFNGLVELLGVGSLVEEYFRMRNKIDDMITVVFDDISMDIHFLYCEYAMPDTFDPEQSFFIASHVQRVHQDSIVAISAVDHGVQTPVIIKAVGHDVSDGALTVIERSVKHNFSIEPVAHFSVAEIINWALNKTEVEAGEDLRDVIYFSIDYAGVTKTCYIVPATAYLTFSFRNMFNVEEFIDVVGVMVTKTEMECDIAVCNTIAKQYDRSLIRTYQVQTEAIPNEEIDMFVQFVSSNKIKMRLEGIDRDVIILDHSCEPSSDDEALATIKFTWRFADKRPRLFDSDFNGIMPTHRQIFDPTFSPEYE